jgi:hypothetical protein
VPEDRHIRHLHRTTRHTSQACRGGCTRRSHRLLRPYRPRSLRRRHSPPHPSSDRSSWSRTARTRSCRGHVDSRTR